MNTAPTRLEDATSTRLIVPDDLVIDDSSVRRLERQLHAAPTSVSGVVAPIQPLPPGSSFRTLAERAALHPLRTGRVAPAVPGATLVRAEVAGDIEITDATVDVGHGEVVVDDGAATHDPWAIPPAIHVADEDGRPPFSWRPLVLLLACESEAGGDDSARALANYLLRRDVEARMAVPVVTPGLHLTRPCRPTEESAVALDPDVVITLDDAAAEEVRTWQDLGRATTIIGRGRDLGDRVELVPWRVGHSSGRLRARIDRQAPNAELLTLVHRLCAGPQPVPPDRPGAPRRRRPFSLPVASGDRASGRAAVRALRIGVVAGVGASRARLGGLADHLRIAGQDVVTSTAVDASAETDLVVIGSTDDPGQTLAAAERCAAEGLTHVVDLAGHDLTGDDPSRPTGLTEHAAEFVASCDAVTVADPAVMAALADLDVRRQIVPTLVPREDCALLRHARHDAEPTLTIGWTGCRDAPDAERDAVVRAVRGALTEHDDLSVELVGGGDVLLDDPELTGRVTAVDDPDPDEIAGWALHIWTPRQLQLSSGDVRPHLDAMLAGVPTAVSPSVRHRIGDHADPRLSPTPADPAAWTTAIAYVLADPARRRTQRRELGDRADLLHGPVGADLVTGRFLGWARRLVTP